MPTAVLLAGLLVEFSWGERHEMLWFLAGTSWALILGLAIAAGTVAAVRVFRSADDGLAASSRTVVEWLRALPGTVTWKFALVWLLMACAFLRAYRLEDQPLDDDEYASTQAILAIAEHGTPKYTEEVYYTRSPLYHYAAAGVVKLVGANIWSLRLPSVVAVVATAWLIYLCGARLLGSPWVGLGALALFAIHPYAIFSSHLARGFTNNNNSSRCWRCTGSAGGL